MAHDKTLSDLTIQDDPSQINEALSQLIEAVKYRDIRTVTYILQHNRGITKKEINEHKLMHLLFQLHNLNLQVSITEIMKLFLDLGVDVNVKNDEGLTVLHLAIDNRMTFVIDFLINHGANLNVCDGFGDSIIHYIIKKESYRADKMIDSETTGSARYVMRQLHQKKSIDFFRWMLSKGVNVDCQRNWPNYIGDTALHHALKERHACLAKEILNYSNNIDARDYYGNTALNIIMHYDDDELYTYNNKDENLVAALVFKGANIHKLNNKFFSPLIKAVNDRHLNFLKIFAERGANFCHPYSNGNLLHYFFRTESANHIGDYKKILNFLIDQGCDVNAKDPKGMTPLQLAVRRYKPKVIRLLIKRGANINSRDSVCGYTPLHEAVEYNNINDVLMLLKKGADVNARTQKGRLALHLIKSESVSAMKVPEVYRGEINLAENPQVNIGKYVVKILINYGCDINVKDANGFLPLHAAILRRDQELMNELFRFGADINDCTYRLNIEDYEEVSEFISEHLVKLYVSDQPIDRRLQVNCYNAFGCHTKAELQESCLKEIERLKNYKITNSMSLYGFLHININAKCSYVRNEELKVFINSSVLEQNFPLYHTLISSRYYMAVHRKKMLEPAIQAWLMLTNVRLPDLCMYEIFKHLSNVDLRLMIGRNLDE